MEHNDQRLVAEGDSTSQAEKASAGFRSIGRQPARCSANADAGGRTAPFICSLPRLGRHIVSFRCFFAMRDAV